MKALSFQQPWAWLLAHGKSIDNRSWKSDYRGPLAIHVVKKTPEGAFDQACAFVDKVFGRKAAAEIPQLRYLPHGGVVGVVSFDRVIDRKEPELYDYLGLDRRWHFRDKKSYGLVLTGYREIAFTACSATRRSGLWDAPLDPKQLPGSRLPRCSHVLPCSDEVSCMRIDKDAIARILTHNASWEKFAWGKTPDGQRIAAIREDLEAALSGLDPHTQTAHLRVLLGEERFRLLLNAAERAGLFVSEAETLQPEVLP